MWIRRNPSLLVSMDLSEGSIAPIRDITNTPGTKVVGGARLLRRCAR
jgi:hypothetical protein